MNMKMNFCMDKIAAHILERISNHVYSSKVYKFVNSKKIEV